LLTCYSSGSIQQYCKQTLGSTQIPIRILFTQDALRCLFLFCFSASGEHICGRLRPRRYASKRAFLFSSNLCGLKNQGSSFRSVAGPTTSFKKSRSVLSLIMTKTRSCPPHSSPRLECFLVGIGQGSEMSYLYSDGLRYQRDVVVVLRWLYSRFQLVVAARTTCYQSSIE
jgi:hypothetical protein